MRSCIKVKTECLCNIYRYQVQIPLTKSPICTLIFLYGSFFIRMMVPGVTEEALAEVILDRWQRKRTLCSFAPKKNTKI